MDRNPFANASPEMMREAMQVMGGSWQKVQGLTRHMYEATKREVTLDTSSERSFLDFMGNYYGLLEFQTKGLVGKFQNDNNTRVGCKASCSACCYQFIYLSTAEVYTIAKHLIDTLPEDELANVRSRCAETARRTANLDHTQRYQQTIACPLLKGKNCGIYGARPTACRTYFSASRFACEKGWKFRHKPQSDRLHNVPTLYEPIAYGDAMQAAFDMIMIEHGLEIERVELAGGLAVALEPGALAKWLAGERIYQGVKEQLVGQYYPDVLAMTRRQIGLT